MKRHPTFLKEREKVIKQKIMKKGSGGGQGQRERPAERLLLCSGEKKTGDIEVVSKEKGTEQALINVRSFFVFSAISPTRLISKNLAGQSDYAYRRPSRTLSFPCSVSLLPLKVIWPHVSSSPLSPRWGGGKAWFLSGFQPSSSGAESIQFQRNSYSTLKQSKKIKV